VREFVQLAFAVAGLDYREHVFVDPNLCRRVEDKPLLGNPRKAREKLGWHHQVIFAQLVREMVQADCEALGISLPPEKPADTQVQPLD
jgi:GDPmannose 4,6-dehydratase